MTLVEVYTFDGATESVRLDQIESIVAPSGRVHDHGAIRLLSGRQITLGASGDQIARLIARVREAGSA